MTQQQLTQERLCEVLNYDPTSGEFKWLVSRGGKSVGKIAGHVSSKDLYQRITIDDVAHLGHRLAFLYMTGKFPKFTVDHIDCDKTNNRWINLREANHSLNGANRGPQRNSSSGIKGVYWNKRKRKWDVRIMAKGRQFFIGFFDDKEKASVAYTAASIKHFGEFARCQAAREVFEEAA